LNEDDLTDTLPMAIKTKKGIFVLLTGLILVVLGLLLTIPPIIILGRILSISGYISILTGVFFIFSGRKLKESKHERLTIAGSIIVALATFVLLLITLYKGWIDLFEISRNIDPDTYGSEVVDLFQRRAPLIWIEALMVIFGASGFVLLIWNMTSRWGRILLILFMIGALGSSIGGGILLRSALNDHVDDIEDTEIFTEEEVEEMGRELTMKMYPSTLMRLTDLLILVIALIPAFKKVRELVKESYVYG
jgi:hypothetical protein